MSLVLAFDPNPETRADDRDIFDESPAAAEKAITSGDYLTWRFAKTFSYREKRSE